MKTGAGLVWGVVGWKNAGKTTLVERLVAELVGRGLRVSTVKHAHHAFDVDQPGRDSHRHRQAGASEVLVASSVRWALMAELRGAPEPDLASLLEKLAPVDIVLVESFKRAPHPKIEVRRAALGHPPLAETDATVRAIASDTPLPGAPRPVLPLDDARAIADFLLSERPR